RLVVIVGADIGCVTGHLSRDFERESRPGRPIGGRVADWHARGTSSVVHVDTLGWRRPSFDVIIAVLTNPHPRQERRNERRLTDAIGPDQGEKPVPAGKRAGTAWTPMRLAGCTSLAYRAARAHNNGNRSLTVYLG